MNLAETHTDTVDALIKTYYRALIRLLDEDLPLKTTTITVRPNAPLYDVTIESSKQNKRKLERKRRKTQSDEDKDKYMQAAVAHTKLFDSSKENHYNN